MQKASQKQEYRWEDFRKEDPPPIDYEAVKDFDSRFFYYDHYSMITESLLHSTSRSIEEEKCMQWAITEEDLEPGIALDPTSYAAKAMQRKGRNLQLKWRYYPQLGRDRPLLLRRVPAPNLQHQQKSPRKVEEFKKQMALQPRLQ